MRTKRFFYIFFFVVFGFLLQFLIHAGVETWYIGLLLNDFPRFGFGWSWQTWFSIHHALSLVLAACGIIFGVWQGRYWWKRIYEKK